MVKLYDISSEYNELEQMVAKGELTADEVKDTLEMIEGEFNDKAKNVLYVSNSLESDISILDKEIKRLQAKKKTILNNKERLREYLRSNMEASGINKIESPTFIITLKKAAQQLYIYDEKSIPDKYVDVVTDIKPSKTEILKDLKAGVDVPGCSIVDGVRSLLIK